MPKSKSVLSNSVIPSTSEESSVDDSLDGTEDVIPSQSEESTVWMLHFA